MGEAARRTHQSEEMEMEMGLELSSSLCLLRFCADRFGRICRMPDKDHGETDLIGHGDRKREKNGDLAKET